MSPIFGPFPSAYGSDLGRIMQGSLSQPNVALSHLEAASKHNGLWTPIVRDSHAQSHIMLAFWAVCWPSPSSTPTSTMVSPALEPRAVEALRTITQTAQLFATSLGAQSPLPRALDRIAPVTVIPSPEPITHLLVSSGLRPDVAGTLSSAYLQSALHLKQEFDRQIHQTILASGALVSVSTLDSDKLIAAIHTAFGNRYRQTIEEWRDRAVARAKERVSALSSASHREITSQSLQGDKRPTFRSVRLLLIFTRGLVLTHQEGECPYPGESI